MTPNEEFFAALRCEIDRIKAIKINEGSVLLEAEQIVNGARRETYGAPKENHERTASLWTAYLSGRLTLTARDVCMLNILQKISRDRHSPKRDNLVDGIGYFANAAELNP